MQLDHFKDLSIDGLLPRNVDIWLPPAYEENPNQRYPVLYMHDGQNLFEPEKAYTGITWGVAEAITRLAKEGKIEPAIVVGIWNTENRFGDYLPAKPFHTPKGRRVDKLFRLNRGYRKAKLVADEYLKLIVEIIKPKVDESYRTKPDRSHTHIMGSSMGGLISWYAMCEYPDVFGSAGCVSTHWPVVKHVFREYFEEKLPSSHTHKIYFSHGTEGLDKKYPKLQHKADQIVREMGYTKGENWITKVFEGDTHNEECWQQQIHHPLTFLLGK
ncbi:MAG: alpha/beta hydrolase-fold protein [Anaerolineae bacterium]|jgi:predicted alpha/beta superfamily hydrolase|nr:alpha/beta hydrolase-fold protein [Anaerolineae bacterium]